MTSASTGIGELRLNLLGPMRAWRDGREVSLGPPKQRAVLGLLASRVNDVVPFTEIIDAVWGSAAPQTAANGVHTYVAGLRRVLEPGRGQRGSSEVLVSAGGGYALRMPEEDVDVGLFIQRLAEARRRTAQGDRQGALDAFEAALGLWRGEAYFNVPGPFAAIERARLHELRLFAVEECAGLMLAAGRHADAVTMLSDAVTKEPLREKLRWLLMLALYRWGRQAEALSVYRDTRQLLHDELGIEPSADLRELHRQILTGDPALGAVTSAMPAVVMSGTDDRPAPVTLPAQVPARVRVFVGRGCELSQLRKLAEPEQPPRQGVATIAVIEGPAGVGKTSLAVQVAHDVSARFPDGQLFVDLGGSGRRTPMDAAGALAFLLRSLGVGDGRLPADLASRVALYRSLVYGRRVLVLVDDAIDAEQVRPLIPGGPAYVLVTSRSRLAGLVARDGACRINLAPLAPVESIELLNRLVGEERLAGQQDDVARLAEHCGHLPVALRLAAESLLADPDRPVAELLERHVARRERLHRLVQLRG